jgi:hypothetical protein
MTGVGLIHMACDCGADLFYVGDGTDGRSPTEAIDWFAGQMGARPYGIFTRANGAFGECPHCGLLFELPDPRLMGWLPRLDLCSFVAALSSIRAAAESSPGGGGPSRPYDFH